MVDIQYFIFNYGHYQDAVNLFNAFRQYGDTYLLNCASGFDPEFEATDKIKKFSNIYYSGQWNEALKLLTADVIFITNSDVRVYNVPRLVCKMKNFYEKYGNDAGIYAPNHFWTPWTYNPWLLEDVGGGLKKVPGTDSTIWSVNSSIARKLGIIDLNTNKLGWGIELICAYYCVQEGKLVVRDYSIKCHHPEHTAYDRVAADQQWRKMIEGMNLGPGFWQHYDSRNKYHFGWRGDDDPLKFRSGFDKMLL